MPKAIVVAFLLLSCAVSAAGRDLYVDNVAGNDSFDGGASVASGSGIGPCRTITRALRVADKGDRVILAATGIPYRESITLQAGRHRGVSKQPFEIVGNGAILEGATPVPREAWEHVRGDVYRFAPPRKSFQLLFLDGRPAGQVAMPPASRRLPELKAQQWCLFEQHLYFCTETGRLPRSYALSYCGAPVGITLYEVRHVIIRDLIVQGFQLDGINAHDGTADVTLSRITCRGNGRSGISIGGASRVRIEESLIGNNGTAQLRTEGESHTHLVNCDLLDNTAPALDRQGGEVHLENAPAENAQSRGGTERSPATETRRYSVAGQWPLSPTAYESGHRSR